MDPVKELLGQGPPPCTYFRGEDLPPGLEDEIQEALLTSSLAIHPDYKKNFVDFYINNAREANSASVEAKYAILMAISSVGELGTVPYYSYESPVIPWRHFYDLRNILFHLQNLSAKFNLSGTDNLFTALQRELRHAQAILADPDDFMALRGLQWPGITALLDHLRQPEDLMDNLDYFLLRMEEVRQIVTPESGIRGIFEEDLSDFFRYPDERKPAQSALTFLFLDLTSFFRENDIILDSEQYKELRNNLAHLETTIQHPEDNLRVYQYFHMLLTERETICKVLQICDFFARRPDSERDLLVAIFSEGLEPKMEVERIFGQTGIWLNVEGVEIFKNALRRKGFGQSFI